MTLRTLSTELLYKSNLVEILNLSADFRKLINNYDFILYLKETKNGRKKSKLSSNFKTEASVFNKELVRGLEIYLGIHKGILKNQLASTLCLGFPKIEEVFLYYQTKDWLLGNQSNNNFALHFDNKGFVRSKAFKFLELGFKLPKGYGSIQQMLYAKSNHDAESFLASLTIKKYVYKSSFKTSSLFSEGFDIPDHIKSNNKEGVSSFNKVKSSSQQKISNNNHNNNNNNNDHNNYNNNNYNNNSSIDINKKNNLSYNKNNDSIDTSLDGDSNSVDINKKSSVLILNSKPFSSKDIYEYDYHPSDLTLELTKKYDLPNEGHPCFFNQIKDIFLSKGISKNDLDNLLSSSKIMELVSETIKGDYISERVEKFANLYASNDDFRKDISDLI